MGRAKRNPSWAVPRASQAMGFAIAREDGRKRPYELNPSYKRSELQPERRGQVEGADAARDAVHPGDREREGGQQHGRTGHDEGVEVVGKDVGELHGGILPNVRWWLVGRRRKRFTAALGRILAYQLTARRV